MYASRERGVAAVEFALIVPLLVLFLFGIVEAGTRYTQQNQVNHWAYLTARDLSIDPTKSATTVFTAFKGSDTHTFTVSALPATPVFQPGHQPDHRDHHLGTDFSQRHVRQLHAQGQGGRAMRELMTRLNHPRDEFGVAAIFFGLAITVLVGALGLSADIGNVAYQRNNAQHGADAAARNLAYQCARYPAGATCSSLQTSAVAIAGDAIDGSTVTATRNTTAKTVTVTVAKTVETRLLSLVGIPSKNVLATATAKVGVMQPTEAYNILPLGVHYCTWKSWSNLAGTATEATRKTTLRTDALQGVENLLSPITSGLLNTIDTKGLTDQLGTDAVQRCSDGDGDQILTLTGASWLTGETVVTGIVKGLFGWDASKCELDVDSDLETFLGGLENSGFMPQGCPSQFGNGKLVDKGKTILLPVFKPKSALADRLDFKLRACVSLFSAARTCAEVPPKIGVEIIGFAPFHVTGWKYPGNPNNVDATVGCAPIPLKLNLKSLIANVLGILEVAVNLLLGLLVPTNLTASISCNGLQGYFTKSFTKDPNATYGTGAEDLGASYASLID